MVTENQMIDQHGRRMRKLRISLLDACNFRCVYCMPEDATFKQKEKLITVDEIIRICTVLTTMGLEQVRLTGGEPTLRLEFEEIVKRLSDLNIKKLGLTTNGFYLAPKLEMLKETKCQSINISLDSLKEEKFNQLTRSNGFKKVYNSILRAKEMGFDVKINAVLMRHSNCDEISDFIDFSAKTGIEIRFLEMMKIGQAVDNAKYYITADEVIEQMKINHQLEKMTVDYDSTSFKYKLNNGAVIGFIASESKPFCNTCSRLRLTCDGKLLACLMSDNGMDLKGIYGQELEDRIFKTINMKPFERIESINRNMFEVGG